MPGEDVTRDFWRRLRASYPDLPDWDEVDEETRARLFKATRQAVAITVARINEALANIQEKGANGSP